LWPRWVAPVTEVVSMTRRQAKTIGLEGERVRRQKLDMLKSQEAPVRAAEVTEGLRQQAVTSSPAVEQEATSPAGTTSRAFRSGKARLPGQHVVCGRWRRGRHREVTRTDPQVVFPHLPPPGVGAGPGSELGSRRADRRRPLRHRAPPRHWCVARPARRPCESGTG
jgi:hypothetical protein